MNGAWLCMLCVTAAATRIHLWVLLQTLPTDPAHARANLEAVEQELREMDVTHLQLRHKAKRLPRIALWAGLAGLIGQVGSWHSHDNRRAWHNACWGWCISLM